MPVVPPTPGAIERAAEELKGGSLVVFPTETVYGLGAEARNPDAVESVFVRKGRPSNNPLIVHVADEHMARSVSSDWSLRAQQLARAFWPGPLTLVVPANESVPGVVTAHGPTIAVRCPAHPVARALLEEVRLPLVAPSANPSGYVSPTQAEHAAEHFGDLLVLDGGACEVGIESSVFAVETLEILRPGVIGPSQIEAVLGERVSKRVPSASGQVEASPGRLGAHYRPRARTLLVDEMPGGRAGLEVVIGSSGVQGRVVVLSQATSFQSGHEATMIEMPASAREYAAGLYAALREADTQGVGLIVVVRPDTSDGDGLWGAILERLTRATTQATTQATTRGPTQGPTTRHPEGG